MHRTNEPITDTGGRLSSISAYLHDGWQAPQRYNLPAQKQRRTDVVMYLAGLADERMKLSPYAGDRVRLRDIAKAVARDGVVPDHTVIEDDLIALTNDLDTPLVWIDDYDAPRKEGRPAKAIHFLPARDDADAAKDSPQDSPQRREDEDSPLSRPVALAEPERTGIELQSQRFEPGLQNHVRSVVPDNSASDVASNPIRFARPPGMFADPRLPCDCGIDPVDSGGMVHFDGCAALCECPFAYLTPEFGHLRECSLEPTASIHDAVMLLD